MNSVSSTPYNVVIRSVLLIECWLWWRTVTDSIRAEHLFRRFRIQRDNKANCVRNFSSTSTFPRRLINTQYRWQHSVEDDFHILRKLALHAPASICHLIQGPNPISVFYRKKIAEERDGTDRGTGSLDRRKTKREMAEEVGRRVTNAQTRMKEDMKICSPWLHTRLWADVVDMKMSKVLKSKMRKVTSFFA